MTTQHPVIIVGAGLAGLSCALHLTRRGRKVLVLEAADAVGGRVRTDQVDGFLLDRGFQVLFTAYPEAQQLLDYGALDLRSFFPGALVHRSGRTHLMADPSRRPLSAFRSLFSSMGTLSDKMQVLTLRRLARTGRLADLYGRPATTSLDALRSLELSEAMLNGFFRPLLGGIFLGRDLSTSSRMLEFVIRMMANGNISIPASGMGAIPAHLAAHLPDGSIRTGTKVVEVAAGGITTETGERIVAPAVVVATEGDVAADLTGRFPTPGYRSTSTLYFTAEAPPYHGPYLMLDGDGLGPVNNLCVLSEVSPAYAPTGQVLISATVPGDSPETDAALVDAVREQLIEWFGPGVQQWRHLRTYRIRWALPDQPPQVLDPVERPVSLGNGLYVAGDHRDIASIQGALSSGRRAAEAILRDKR